MRKFNSALAVAGVLLGLNCFVLHADETVVIQHVHMKKAGQILKEGDLFIIHPDGQLSVPRSNLYHSPQVNHYVLMNSEVHIEGRTLQLPYACRPLQFLVQKVRVQTGAESVTDIYIARYAGAIGELPVYTDSMTEEESQKECMKGAETQPRGSTIPQRGGNKASIQSPKNQL